MRSNTSTGSASGAGVAVVTAALVVGTAFGYSLCRFRIDRLQQKSNAQSPAWSQGAESHLWKMVEYSLSTTMIGVADQLNLFERLYKSGPATSQDLAAETKWSERWLREILLQLAGSGICVYEPNGQTFALKEEYARFLRGPQQEKVRERVMMDVLHCT